MWEGVRVGAGLSAFHLPHSPLSLPSLSQNLSAALAPQKATNLTTVLPPKNATLASVKAAAADTMAAYKAVQRRPHQLTAASLKAEVAVKVTALDKLKQAR